MSQVPPRVLRNVRSTGSLRPASHNNYRSRPGSPYSIKKESVDFSPEPYVTGKNFAVFTPTDDSVEKLYKSNHFKPQRYISQKRPQLENPEEEIPYHTLQKASVIPESVKTRSSRTSIPIAQRISNAQLTPANLEQFERKQQPKEGKPMLLHKLKSYKTNSTVSIIQGLPLKKVNPESLKEKSSNKPQNNTQSGSMRKTISYSGIPWVQLDPSQRYNDPYNKTSHVRTMAALRASGSESVQDIIHLSKTISSNLNEMVSQQFDPKYLQSNRMNPLPQPLKYPVVQQARAGKRLLLADNTAHCRETNFGYSRKANGTFYNH